jgi:two-component sensor histidine kinase
MSMQAPDEAVGGGFARLLSALPLSRQRPLVGYAAAMLFSGAGLLLRWLFEPLLPPGYPFVTFFPVVVATAFLFGLRAAVLAAVLCGFLSRWFFIAPHHSLALDHGAGMAMALYLFVVGVDIFLIELMQRAVRQLETERLYSRQLADHREILFRELQHRVGNNLQMVGALLSLQKRKLTDPEARAAIGDAAHRLALIGRIQRELYGAVDDQRGLDVFLREITRDLVASAGRDDITHEVEGGEGLWLHPDDAIPVALIVAEVVANALEHGFAGRERGIIRLSIAQGPNELAIAIENDGHSLPEGFDPDAGGSLGLKLARNLAAGRQGSFHMSSGGLGTIARVGLPMNRAAA